MSKTPKYDAKIKEVLDAVQPGERTDPITGEKWNLDQDYLERCRQRKVPPSKFSPLTRMRLIAIWCSGVDLWWKPHFETNKPILACSPPDSIVPMVTDLEYASQDYGNLASVDYQVDQPFFQQQAELIKQVPLGAYFAYDSEGCIGNGFSKCINTFIVCGTYEARDSWYVFRCRNVERCTDVTFLENCENCFSCSMSVRLNGCTQVFDSVDCINSSFLFDCRNCENCFGCTNLRRKSYMFMNKQLSKEEYQAKMSEIDLSCRSTFKKHQKQFHQLMHEQAFWPENFNINAPDCQGDYMLDCTRSNGYFSTGVTDVLDSWFLFNTENSETVVIGNDSQDLYYTGVSIACQNTKFCFVPYHSTGLEYCVRCNDCQDCFGCVGLKKKRFCIFNKEYQEEEYWQRVDQLKCSMLDRGEYGDWFPASIGVQHPEISFASMVSPFSDQELERMSVAKFDPKQAMRHAPYPTQAVKDAAEAPDCIQDVGDEWVGVQFEDKDEQRQYNVNAQELKWRKDHGYPFPDQHYRGRLRGLVNQINCAVRVDVNCSDCNKSIRVNDNRMFPERKIKCMDCYLKYLEQHG